MNQAERERLARNYAEVIDELYQPPFRERERRIELVRVQVQRAMQQAERYASSQ